MTRVAVEEILDFSWRSEESEGESSSDSETELFARILLAGTCEHIAEIDGIIKEQLEHWDFNRLGRVDLAILRMSVFSLLYQRDIPPSVTIDEAVDIAKEFGTDESYRFVNGVLDGIHKKYPLQ